MKHMEMPDSWLICHDLNDWSEWLSTHYETEKEVWVQIQKSDSLIAGIHLAEAVEEAIRYGWIDGMMHSLNADCYILRFTPRRPDSRWSLNNRRRAEALIALDRMTKAGMETVEAAKANGQWSAAYSAKEEPELPQDLRAALQVDTEALNEYESWPNSSKFQLVDWVLQSKRKETRQARIRKIVESAHEKKRII